MKISKPLNARYSVRLKLLGECKKITVSMNEISSDGSHLVAPLATVPAGQRSNSDTDWFPPVDILGDAVEYLFRIDLPDVPPENIRVYVEQDELVISGERPPPSLTDQECLRIERPHGHFERRFALPEDASQADIEPLFRECVLELHVRKVGQVNPVTETPPRQCQPAS